VGFEALQGRNKEADKAVESFGKSLQAIKTQLDEMRQLHLKHSFKSSSSGKSIAEFPIACSK